MPYNRLSENQNSIVYCSHGSNSAHYVSCKIYKAVTKVLKKIYHSVTGDETLNEFEKFELNWNSLKTLPISNR